MLATTRCWLLDDVVARCWLLVTARYYYWSLVVARCCCWLLVAAGCWSLLLLLPLALWSKGGRRGNRQMRVWVWSLNALTRGEQKSWEDYPIETWRRLPNRDLEVCIRPCIFRPWMRLMPREDIVEIIWCHFVGFQWMSLALLWL